MITQLGLLMSSVNKSSWKQWTSNVHLYICDWKSRRPDQSSLFNGLTSPSVVYIAAAAATSVNFPWTQRHAAHLLLDAGDGCSITSLNSHQRSSSSNIPDFKSLPKL